MTRSIIRRGVIRRLRSPEQGRALMAVPYLGFGNATRIWLKGRLLDDSQQFSNDGRPLDATGKPMSRVRWWWKRWSEAGQV
mgnify:CR=1 FL=1